MPSDADIPDMMASINHICVSVGVHEPTVHTGTHTLTYFILFST